ncbi:tannase/feruloyl esterase family alpha/beta hydrolase [Polymorphobacter sp.]|uniref:tannase/feruloyl esterase family alpha/beta hydrolase n=1 Tax=Polymorphobacter sp. TaxID=1909290 RepID=UPI003F727FAF
MIMRWLLMAMMLVATPVMAEQPPEAACAALAAQDFSSGTEAPAHLMASAVLAAAEGLPALCRVEGFVAPNTGFELRLPLKGWNGKFFHAGCTGSCGFAAASPWVKECDEPVSRGYACIVSDMGHRSTASEGLWAWHNNEARIDFGFRATHRTTVVGKAITRAFYAAAPAHAYFMGCSTGGRQALVSAQRFPDDFDGIIAGAPVISEGGTSMSFLWNLQALSPVDGKPLFDAAALALVKRAALAAADGRDGARDRLIADPRGAFDPLTLICKPGQARDCLTRAQAEAVAKVYAGPHDSKGRPLYNGGGFMPGSEENWLGYVTPPGGRARAWRSGVDTTRYIMTDWGPDWNYSDFDFDQDAPKLAEKDVFYAANNPDLRDFKARGGKLIIYHGWNDPAVAPLNSVDYHGAVTRAMGGPATTDDFARLFMVPGMNHCYSGDGAFAVDWISALEAWVEKGEAPARLVATHLAGSHDSPSMIRRMPPDVAQRTFTRPLFPWPVQARYTGTGDPADMRNWQPDRQAGTTP